MKTQNKSLCVLAGAGSGKTTYLVERFLEAVIEQKVDPLSILAITFTDKAAIELKERLVLAFEKKGLFEERQKLEQAYIGTIHSFCSRILRENPIEAGVDPGFQILGEGESEILMNRILDELFENEAQSQLWLSLLTDYGEEALRAAFATLYDMHRALGEENALFKINASVKTEKMARALLAQKAAELPDELSAALKQTLQRELSWKLLLEVQAKAKAFTLRSGKTKAAVQALREALETWLAEAVAILSEPQKKEFLRLFFLFKEKFDTEKKTRAFYDFEDLLCLTYRLVKSDDFKEKAVRKHYQDYFNLIFVDEYQDTSFLQHEIIFSLKKLNNLFVVGDLEQSIYGFRYAEPELLAHIHQSADFEKMELRKNYRSKADVLEFINQTFEDKNENPFFSALIPTREANKGPNGVQILAIEKDDEKVPNLEKARLLEASLLAKSIREMVQSGEFSYGQIAMLFRSTTAIHFYEKALQDAGIPYYAMKGKSFFEKPEILDVLSFLELIENPNLDVSLAAVLRSPFVRVSDDSLFWLADFAKKNNKERPLIHGVYEAEAIKELSAEDRKKIVHFRSQIQILETMKARLRISEVIEKILNDFYYEAKILTRPNGKQKLANVQKLLEMSRSLEEKGIFSIQEFVNHLKRVSEEGTTETEAKIQALDQDTVKLFTVHASKGLEFPCVILADMGQEPKKNTQGAFIFSKAHGFSIKARNPLSLDTYEDTSYAAALEDWASKQSAEDKRLLYVAMTRAKERLILSGCDNANSWMGHILKIHPAQKLQDIENFSTPARLTAPSEATFLDSKEMLVNLEERLHLPEKPYDHYDDLTVTDLLVMDHPVLIAYEKEEPQEDDEDKAPRNEYGTVFHKIMEHLVREKPKTLSLKAPFWNLANALSEAQQKELRDSVIAFWKGPLAKEIRESKHVYPELPFIYRTKHGILKGQIDLIYERKSGEWVVLDYKTNQFESQTREELAKFYEFQLGMYALIFKKLYGEAPKRGLLYFSSTNEISEFLYEKASFAAFEKTLEERFRACALSR